MSNNSIKASPADIAVNVALILLTAIIAVLLCIYCLKQNGAFDEHDEVQTPHVIGTELSAETTVTTPIVTTTAATVTTPPETVTEAIDGPVVPEFTPEFFEKTFIIGDSLSLGFINYEYLLPENIFARVAITPSSVMTTKIDGETVYDKVSAFNPERICIMLGTNGLSYLKESYMADKMNIFIDELEKICPDAQVILVSIPSVTASHEAEKPEKVQAIMQYNEHIKKLAAERSLVYADSFPLLCDENGYLGENYAETDGLHLKIHAYPVILGTIQFAVENNTVPALDDINEELLVDSVFDGEETASDTAVETVQSE